MSFNLDEKVDLKRAKTISLGDRTLHVARLTLRSIISLAELQPKLSASTAPGNIETAVDCVLLGLKRTYPSLTKDELLDLEMTPSELAVAVGTVIEQASDKKAAAEST